MRGFALQERVHRAELSDYAAFRTFLTIAAGIEGFILLLWSLVYLGNLSIFLTSVILGGAAGAFGAIFGFLLGIPKAATLTGCGKSRSVVLPARFVAFCPVVTR